MLQMEQVYPLPQLCTRLTKRIIAATIKAARYIFLSTIQCDVNVYIFLPLQKMSVPMKEAEDNGASLGCGLLTVKQRIAQLKDAGLKTALATPPPASPRVKTESVTRITPKSATPSGSTPKSAGIVRSVAKGVRGISKSIRRTLFTTPVAVATSRNANNIRRASTAYQKTTPKRDIFSDESRDESHSQAPT